MSNTNLYTSSIVTMARGAGIVFFGIFISRVLGYGLRVTLKHTLGLEDFGLLWSSYNVIEMVTFFCLVGIPNALSRYIAFYKTQNNPRRVGGFIIIGFVSILPFVLVVTFILFWQADYFAAHLFHKPDIKPLLQIFSFAILPLTLMFMFGSVFRGFKLMPEMVFTQQLSRNIFMLLCFGLFILFGFGPESAVWAMLIGTSLTAVVAFVQFIRQVERQYMSNIELRGVFAELWHYSWPLVFTTLFWNMSGRIDVFFLTIYESESNVGVYNAILPLAQFVPVVMQSFVSILMPMFSSIFANFDRAALHSLHQAATKWIIAFTLPFFLLLVVFSDSILLVLLGRDTLVGAFPLCVIALGYFFNAIFGIPNIILAASAHTKLNLLNTSVYIAMNILLNILLIPRIGLLGAAVAGMVSMSVMNIFAVYENFKLYGIKPFNRQNLYLFLISFIIAGIIFLAKHAMPPHLSLLTIAGGSFLFLLLYFGGLKIIRIFDANDLAIIIAVENKVGKKLGLLRRIVG